MNAIDEFHTTLAAHTIFAGASASTATGKIQEYLSQSINFELKYYEPDTTLGECFLSYSRKNAKTDQ